MTAAPNGALPSRRTALILTAPRWYTDYEKVRVPYATSHSHLRTILVTSLASEEGKSVVAANLAVAMANAALRVVLVDADLRLPHLHRLFGLSRGQGLTDALWHRDTDGNLKSTAMDGVKVLTSGTLRF